MRLFPLLPLTTATLLPSTNAPISRPFKILILRQLFVLSPRSLLPFFNGDTSFSLRWQVPLLPLNPVVRRRLPFFPVLLLEVLLGVMTPLNRGCEQGLRNRASSTAVSRNASLPSPPHHPDPDGVDGLSSVFGGMGGMGGPRFVGRSSSSYGFYPSRSSFSLGFSTSSVAEHYRQFHFPGTIPEVVSKVVFGGDHHHPPPGGFRHAPPPPSTIIMRLHLWHLRLRSLLRRCVLCPMKISLPLQLRT